MVAALVSTAQLFAQSETGDKEVMFNGSYSITKSGDDWQGFGNIAFGLGYFATAKTEVGFGTNISFVGAFADTTFNGNFFLRYHFTEGQKSAPYFLVDAYIPVHPWSTDSIYTRAGFGVKYYIKRNVAFDFHATYGLSVTHPGNFGQIANEFGLVYVFGK